MTERTDTREAGMPVEPETPPDGWPMVPHLRQWMNYARELKTAHAALREENKELKLYGKHAYEQGWKDRLSTGVKRADALQADLDAAMEAVREVTQPFWSLEAWLKKHAAIISKARRT